MSSAEEHKTRKLKAWASEFPEAGEHLPALLKMRSGPMKDFVDNHLVMKIRSEEWLSALRANLELEAWRDAVAATDESILVYEKKVRKLEKSIELLEKEEVDIENDSFSKFDGFVSGVDLKPMPKNLVFAKEEGLFMFDSLIHQIVQLRHDLEGSHPLSSNSSTNDGAEYSESFLTSVSRLRKTLDGTKQNVAKSLEMSVKKNNARRLVELRESVSEDLLELSQLSPGVDISALVWDWWRGDIESDETQFLENLGEMKEDEKTSAIKKLVREWTSLHVQLGSTNLELNESLVDLKATVERMTHSAPDEIRHILELLIEEKKEDAKYRHYFQIPKPSDSPFFTTHGLVMESSDSLETGATHEFNFNLTLSLLKTWPHVNVVFWKAVENGKIGIENWILECSALLEDLKITYAGSGFRPPS